MSTARHRRCLRLATAMFVASMLLAAGAAGSALAADPGCGAVITKSIKLHDDLLNCPGDGLVVGASGITVDLNGHTVDGTLSGFGPVASGIANPAGYDDVRIVDGTIREFFSGVRVDGADDSTVRDVTVSDTVGGIEIVGSSGARVAGNRVRDAATHPILLLDSDRSEVERNSVLNSADGSGIVVSDSVDNRIVRNYAEGGLAGVTVDLSEGNLVARNLVRRATGFGGIVLLDANRGNEVTHNLVTESAVGIDLEEAAHDNRVTSNWVAGNAGDGIRVTTGSGNAIVRNYATANGDDGIDVEEPGNAVARNRAWRNGDLGIEAVAGTLDGGGNRAWANANPLQCLNVEC